MQKIYQYYTPAWTTQKNKIHKIFSYGIAIDYVAA